MTNYNDIIELLESIKTNKLDMNVDYEVVEILNDTINKIKLCNNNNII